ncbi:MAG: hypothetical protein RLQ12_16615, partial [Cyclobacteriaceae bacterium]
MKNLIHYLIIFVFTISILQAQEQGPQRFEKTILEYEEADKANFPPKGANLFVGSSSIRIWQDIADYFPDHEVINRGFGGSMYSDLLYYLDRIVLPYEPAKIFIYEGDNDIA